MVAKYAPSLFPVSNKKSFGREAGGFYLFHLGKIEDSVNRLAI